MFSRGRYEHPNTRCGKRRVRVAGAFRKEWAWGGSRKQLPGLNTWVPWERSGGGALCTGGARVSQEGRHDSCGPSALPSTLPRGSPGGTTPRAWPSTSRREFLGPGALHISQASLSWKPITGCMPTQVRRQAWESRLGWERGGKEAGGSVFYSVYLTVDTPDYTRAGGRGLGGGPPPHPLFPSPVRVGAADRPHCPLL